MSHTALSSPQRLFQRLTQSVARRLALGYAALLLAVVAVGGLALHQLENLQRESEQAEARHLDRVGLVLALQSGIDRLSVHARNLALADDALAQTQEQRLLNQQQARLDEIERRLRALDWDGASLGLLDGWSVSAAAVRPRLDNLARVGRPVPGQAHGRDAVTTALAQLRPAETAWQQQTQALVRHVTEDAEAALAGHRAAHLAVRQQIATLVVVCLLLGGLLSWHLVRSVRQPVKQAVRMAEKLAQGAQADLTVQGDELQRMQHAMRGLQQRLRAQAVDVTQPVGTAATGAPFAAVAGRQPAAEAQTATAPLSALVAAPLPTATPERARQEPQFDDPRTPPAPQAPTPAADETLQALLQRVQSGRGPAVAGSTADAGAGEGEGVGEGVGGLADSDFTGGAATDPDALVSNAVDVAERGSVVVTQVVSNMEDISASSRKINEILATIDGIAFQTNLLALNAAVQAARAGHEGAGSHGAVAGEVRGLAQRAASAAREIKGLINASLDQAEASNRLVRDAGVTMDALVSSVQSVTDLVGQIGTSSEARTPETLREADRSVRQLDRLTRDNANLVEQSASAADALRDQAERLQKVVAAFRLLQQTQEAAWTAHTAIHSARTTSRGDTLPGGLDDLPPAGTPVADPDVKASRDSRSDSRSKTRRKGGEPPAGNDWKNF